MEQQEGQWFILNTLTQYEKRVRDAIQRQIDLGDPAVPVYEVQYPIEKTVEVKNNVRRNIEKKLFPGYVFVRMKLTLPQGGVDSDYIFPTQEDDNVWQFIRNIKGVSKIGGVMSPLEVSQWISAPGAEGPSEIVAATRPQFNVGDEIIITDGTFTGSHGTVKEIDTENNLLRIETIIFNRLTPMEMEFWQVEKAVE